MKPFSILMIWLALGATAYASPRPVGSDRDAHGCITSAGYQWSDAYKSCIRPFEDNTLKAFPAPTAQEKRFVINLPQAQDEDGLKVELMAGKTLQTDCNRHNLGGGQMTVVNLEGWGYDYYRVAPLSEQSVSTLMACPDQTKQARFVMAPSSNTLVRYNSKLPIVIYAPTGVEIHYRIWQGGKLQSAAAK